MRSRFVRPLKSTNLREYTPGAHAPAVRNSAVQNVHTVAAAVAEASSYAWVAAAVSAGSASSKSGSVGADTGSQMGSTFHVHRYGTCWGRCCTVNGKPHGYRFMSTTRDSGCVKCWETLGLSAAARVEIHVRLQSNYL